MTTDPQPEPRSLADRCRSTCSRGTCTGKGDTARWAHRCQFAPPPPPPACNVCGAQAVDRFLPGWRCGDHAPTYPTPTASDPSDPRPVREYGTATTDPLGRTGPLNQYRVPTHE